MINFKQYFLLVDENGCGKIVLNKLDMLNCKN